MELSLVVSSKETVTVDVMVSGILIPEAELAIFSEDYEVKEMIPTLDEVTYLHRVM